MDIKKTMPGHITVKLLESKDTRKIWKSEEKKYTSHTKKQGYSVGALGYLYAKNKKKITTQIPYVVLL